MHTIPELMSASSVVVYDTEFTSWPGAFQRNWSGPGEHREIVQIGAVRLNAVFDEIEHFVQFCWPTVNPILSDYFTTLTGITNAEVDSRGQSLSAVLQQFAEFCSGAAFVCAFGIDSDIIDESCRLIGVPSPLTHLTFVNVRPLLCELVGVEPSSTFSSSIPAAFGLELQPQIHDGLADARAVASVLRHLKGNGADILPRETVTSCDGREPVKR